MLPIARTRSYTAAKSQRVGTNTSSRGNTGVSINKAQVNNRTLREMRELGLYAKESLSDKEMNILKQIEVYSLVPSTQIPPGTKSIGPRWVYKMKANVTYKLRLVAQGWNQGGSALRWHFRSCLHASEHPHGARRGGGAVLGGLTAGRANGVSQRGRRGGGAFACQDEALLRERSVRGLVEYMASPHLSLFSHVCAPSLLWTLDSI